MPPPVLLVVRRMPELAVAIRAREARQVRVDQHVIVEAVLAREHGSAPPALVRLDTFTKNNIFIKKNQNPDSGGSD